MIDPNLAQEFEDFKTNERHSAPSELSQNILRSVTSELDPDHKLVFFKLLSIQAIVGTLTLIFCPQFNFSLTNNFKIFHFFHQHFGHYGCSMVCGSLFLGTGALIASQILKKPEVQKIKQSKLLYFVSLSGIGVLCFFFLGAQVYLDAALLWIAGAILGSVVLLETGFKFRLYLASHSGT